MSQIPTLLVLTIFLAQSEPAQPPQPPTEPAAEVDKESKEEKVDQPTEAEKLVEEAAAKVDGIEELSATILQTVRAAGRSIVSEGVYRKGKKNHAWVELVVDLGDTTAKRIQACDGMTYFNYEKMLGTESLSVFDATQVLPLIESKELPEQVRNQLGFMLPFIKPGDMLRGYLKTFHFDKVSEGELGDTNKRPVTIVEGSWKKEILPVVAQNPAADDVDDLLGATPQYLRLYLDKETGFPLKVELFRLEKTAEYKPVYTLEFLQVSTEEIPDDKFAFTPPANVNPVDMTAQLVSQLGQFPDKAGAPEKNAAQEVSKPLAP